MQNWGGGRQTKSIMVFFEAAYKNPLPLTHAHSVVPEWSPNSARLVPVSPHSGQAKKTRWRCWSHNSRFSHDVTAAMLVPLNKETAAMLESLPNPPGIYLYYYANVFFCFRWKTCLLVTWVKTNNRSVLTQVRRRRLRERHETTGSIKKNKGSARPFYVLARFVCRSRPDNEVEESEQQTIYSQF